MASSFMSMMTHHHISCSSSSSSSLSSAFLGKRIPSFSPRLHRPPPLVITTTIESRIREIFMPALSSTMTEGKIVAWSRSEGDKLSKGESVVVVESDKADMDVETFYDGILASIIVGEGEVAPVGAAIALLAETEEEIEEAKQKAQGLGVAGTATSSSSTTTTSTEPPSSSEDSVIIQANTSLSNDGPLSSSAETPSSSSSSLPPVIDTDGPRRTIPTPYAKKLAKQYKVNVDSVVGSGPFGRITAADVATAAGKPLPGTPSSSSAKPLEAKPLPGKPSVEPKITTAAAPYPSPAGKSLSEVSGNTVPFSTMQNAVSRNMVESLSVPVFRVGYTISTDALDALYKKVKSKGVTMTALLAKATALALARHPGVNASCKDGKSFTYNSDINIAVAVAMDGGLLTPVLQNADKVDLYALSSKWKELVEKARAKQLQPQEYNSGTFTLSNLGMFGVDRFDAILPPGTGAIMAVGASQKKVVATSDGLLGVKSQMQVNVTADHRIIYGAELAAFLQTFAAIVENPDELTL